MKAGNQIIIFGSQESELKNAAVSDDNFDQYVKTGQTPINHILKPKHGEFISKTSF
jgi:hypothetical protein